MWNVEAKKKQQKINKNEKIKCLTEASIVFIGIETDKRSFDIVKIEPASKLNRPRGCSNLHFRSPHALIHLVLLRSRHQPICWYTYKLLLIIENKLIGRIKRCTRSLIIRKRGIARKVVVDNFFNKKFTFN